MKKNDVCTRVLPWLLTGAVLTALILVFPIFGILEWISMIPLLMGVYRLCDACDCTRKRAYGYGFLTVYAFYFLIYHWIVNLYPLDFVGLDELSSIVVVAAGWLGLPLLQALPGGLVFLIYFELGKRGVFRRFPLFRPFLFASLWVVFEWSSTIGWTGVPWGRLSLGQIELLPVLQSASLFGSYFVSWLLVAVNGLLAFGLLYCKKVVLCALISLSLFFSNLGYGLISMGISRQKDPELRVAVVQGNINSHDKWGEDSFEITANIYREYTRAAAEAGATLVVWPETVLPYVLSPYSTSARFLSSLARECNVTLMVGALHEDEENRLYNALFYVEPDGRIREEVYAKRHLVPFGEYVPMRDLIVTLVPPLANVSALEEDVSPGTDSALFESEWGSIGGLICFDSIYEALAIDSVRDGAELFVLATNDSWFFDSAAVYQHQAQAQLRAVETGRYIVRAGNTGISSIIDPCGETLTLIDPLEKGWTYADVAMIEAQTLYTKIGNTFVLACALFVLLSLLDSIRYDGKQRCIILGRKKG